MDNYNITTGKIIDYKKLSQFLISNSLSQFHYDFFIDLACGTGSLLKQLESDLEKINLYGIDISEIRCNTAKQNTKKVNYLNDDIFNINRYNLCKDNEYGYGHLGFSFINIFDRNKRIELFKILFENIFIKTIGFEIQNITHQLKSFKYNKEYITDLGNNLILITKSTKISKDSYNLNMKFLQNNKQIKLLNELLYDIDLNDLMIDIIKIGWKNICIKQALYRNENDISHWFIEIYK